MPLILAVASPAAPPTEVVGVELSGVWLSVHEQDRTTFMNGMPRIDRGIGVVASPGIVAGVRIATLALSDLFYWTCASVGAGWNPSDQGAFYVFATSELGLALRVGRGQVVRLGLGAGFGITYDEVPDAGAFLPTLAPTARYSYTAGPGLTFGGGIRGIIPLLPMPGAWARNYGTATVAFVDIGFLGG